MLGSAARRVILADSSKIGRTALHWIANMIGNEFVWGPFRPDLEHPTREDVVDVFKNVNVLPIPWMEPQDISNAVLYLVSDAGRYVTGHAHVVDAGNLLKS